MITYRTLKTNEDVVKLKEFCKKNDWPMPTKIEAIFGAFDGDELVACCALRKEFVIMDFINTTKHGHVASVLSEKAFALASVHSDSIMGVANDPEVIELYKKAGAEVIMDGLTYLRKYV